MFVALQKIGWAADAQRAAVQDMGLGHDRFIVFATKQFLDGADVISAVRQMHGGGITESAVLLVL
jgi:hypothetical protein